VLIYENDYKVKSIRLYYDRLEFARAFSAKFFDRILLKIVDSESLKRIAVTVELFPVPDNLKTRDDGLPLPRKI
jgi:hypothetical protein